MKMRIMPLILLVSFFRCAMAGVSGAEQAGSAAPAVEWSNAFARG